MGHVKWVRNLRKKRNKVKVNVDETPIDVVIFAKSFSLELPDDQFEVKLRDNFELMEDEFFEAEKRVQVLKHKIDDLRRSKNIVLSNTKVEELYNNLGRKNVEIYVQR